MLYYIKVVIKKKYIDQVIKFMSYRVSRIEKKNVREIGEVLQEWESVGYVVKQNWSCGFIIFC